MKNVNTSWCLLLLLSGLGLADSFYLSWVKIYHTEVFCGGSSNCETVNSSSYADLFGIPIAFLGLAAYSVIIGILFIGKQKMFSRDGITFAVFGITLIGTLFSIYLTYIEIYVIHAICPYCLVSAVVMLLLLILSINKLFKLLME